jgi:hypothetical protein
MVEPPSMYCGNCGYELSPEDSFCRNCGTPTHQVARVLTPEADVPLPPPPSPEGAGGGEMSPPQDRQFPSDRSLETGPKIFLGLSAVVTLIWLLWLTSTLAGGEDTASQANRKKDTPSQANATRQPHLVVTSPSKPTTVDQTSFEVEGTVTPANADVSVNGERAFLYSSGSFYGVVDLHPGKNEIKVTAVNGSKDAEYSQVVTRKSSAEQAAAQKAENQQPAQQQQAQQGQKQQAVAPVKLYPHFGDGTYQVGTDIQPGTYRTREGSPNCYYERLKNFTGGMNSILANGNTNAPTIVTNQPTDAGFQSQSCGTWTKLE